MFPLDIDNIIVLINHPIRFNLGIPNQTSAGMTLSLRI